MLKRKQIIAPWVKERARLSSSRTMHVEGLFENSRILHSALAC